MNEIEGEEYPLTLVQPDTPKPMIDASNADEVVQLIWCPEGHNCGAAMDDVKAAMQDICACEEPISGGDQGVVITHRERGMQHLPFYRGGGALYICIPR